MGTSTTIPARLAEHIEHILVDLRNLTRAECVMLADVSGQLISIQGEMQEVDPALMAAMAAADVVATAELVRLIGGRDPGGALFRQGRHVNVYLFDIADRFILIVIFRASTLAGLVHTFGRRSVGKLRPLVTQFENWKNDSTSPRFATALVEELDETFKGL